MTKYKVRYTPEAVRDMEAVWDGVYEASKEPDIADRYVNDFIDEIEKKKQFRFQEYRLYTEDSLPVFMQSILRNIRHFTVYMTIIGTAILK